MNLGCPALTWTDEMFEGRHKVQDRPVAVHRLHAVRPGLHHRLHQADSAAVTP